MPEPSKDEVAFLAMLSSGEDFTRAARSLGDLGVKVAFNCVLNGWVDRGLITEQGRAAVRKALTPTPWEITVLPAHPTCNGKDDER
jgi:hypothetical protein